MESPWGTGTLRWIFSYGTKFPGAGDSISQGFAIALGVANDGHCRKGVQGKTSLGLAVKVSFSVALEEMIKRNASFRFKVQWLNKGGGATPSFGSFRGLINYDEHPDLCIWERSPGFDSPCMPCTIRGKQVERRPHGIIWEFRFTLIKEKKKSLS